MTVKLGVVMDPIENIVVEKDSTLALLLAAQKRKWKLFYISPQKLWLSGGTVYANTKLLKVKDDTRNWYHFEDEKPIALSELNVVLMRMDPPVNMNYIYVTQLLDFAQQQGTFIVNKPQSLRNFNEKLFIEWFPQCIVPTLVTADHELFREFHHMHGTIICKPLDGMGGQGIFRLQPNDGNANAVFEMLSSNGKHFMIAQRNIPEISQGDKRIILIDGKPLPFALARIPQNNEVRGNLAVGGLGKGVELSERDYWICDQVAGKLRENGILFAGLDVIGDYLTEINITSPTCIRQLEKIYKVDIAGQIIDCIERKMAF